MYEALGLENAVDTPGGGFYVSAAPLSMQTFEYFESLGIELQGGTLLVYTVSLGLNSCVNGKYLKKHSKVIVYIM